MIDQTHINLETIPERLRGWAVEHGIQVLIILAVGAFVIWLVRVTTRGLTQYIGSDSSPTIHAKQQRAATLSSIINSLVRLVVISIVSMMILEQIGISIGPILAGAGVIGLAIGFGAQTLVRDFLSGFFIVLEDQFGIGDSVTIGDATGVVERMTLRMTVIRDGEGRLQYLPNSSITKVTVVARDWSIAIVDVTIAYQTNLDQAIGILQRVSAEIAEENKESIIEKPVFAGVQALADNGIVVRTTFKTKPEKRGEIASGFRRRLRFEFGRAGLEVPVSQLPVKLTSETSDTKK